MQSKFENMIVYSIIGISIFAIVLLSYYSMQKSKGTSEVVLYKLKATINDQCDDICLRNLNQSISKINSVYELDFDNEQVNIVYDRNQIDENMILDSVKVPMNIISNEKVIMKCPEKCAYCDSETGICKSFD